MIVLEKLNIASYVNMHICKGMDFTSTPFDYASADYLENMVDFYKISSSDLTNLPFIRHIGAKGKPVYISVGAAYLSEVDKAVRALKESGCKILLFYIVFFHILRILKMLTFALLRH